MDNDSTLLLPLVAGVFALAGLVKGISGMGLPTFSMALLSLAMPPASAAALMVLPSLATNVAQCVGPHWRMLMARLWPLWLGLVLAALLSPLPDVAAAAGARAEQARLVLGVVLVSYGAWGWARPSLPDLRRHGAWMGGVAGAMSGVLTAATGVFVMPLVPYLQALRLGKDELMQALGISFTIATVALAVRLGHAADGAGAWWPATNLAPLGIALVAAFAGMGAGAVLRARMRQAVFQRALYAVFAGLGMVMVVRAA